MADKVEYMTKEKKPFLVRHSLSIAVFAVVLTWICLYAHSNPDTHAGSFYGNAIADWTGLFVTVIATKYLHEKGSPESNKLKKLRGVLPKGVHEFLREHSLVIFLVITGAGWTAAFLRMSPTEKWGQVVGNIVSEWTQILGVVIMTKRLVEAGSKEGRKTA
ncbi:MAG: hypothetical protein JWO13_2589 [Acidobacteriales bacterium]|nr:hypothetical protein [Terriglobales bacterium]